MVRNKLSALLLCLLMLFSASTAAHAGTANEFYTVAQVQGLCDGIVAYKGYGSAQSFIDDYLCANAGSTAEFYAISLSQLGNYDFSGYERALKAYLSTHEVYSATSREKYALALSAAGSTDSYITDTADEAIGGLGIMSLDFGLHLLNNGYESALYSVDGLITDILSYEMDGGGWAVMGSRGDVDVTAMTVQALAPYYGSRGDLTAAVDRAIDLLSDKQLGSGGFKTMGAENCESAAQVIIALSALGIDAQTDERFIKNGNSAMTGMMQYYLSDGSFAHTGYSSNESAVIEAFCALTAYRRMCYGQSSLYILDRAVHPSPSGGNEPRQKGSDKSGSSSSSRNRDDSGGSRHGTGGDDKKADSKSDGSNSEAETDEDGNRIIVIDGRRYIEATTASGEKMTVSVSETEGETEHSGTSQAAIVKPTHGGFQSSATEDSKMKAATADEASTGGGYKLYVIIGILAAGGIACAVLFLLKKRGMKHYIVVAALTAAGVIFILLTDFKSADSYSKPAKTDGELTVTLSIRCDTITDKEKVNYYIPDDGTVLDAAEYAADEGETVYDVLVRAAAANHIQLDNRGGPGSAYIAGINSLYEFDYGDLSGWMYRVNGEFPDVGCQSCTVSDGDVIEWLYTTNIGKDL